VDNAKLVWEMVCKSTSLGSLGILNFDKFATALRLRWPWFEWTAPDRPWVGLETPCNKDDMSLFYLLTKVTIGEGNKACFWNAPWMGGLSPINIVPSIFKISKRKVWSGKLSIMMLGWIKLTPLRRSPCNILKNLHGGLHVLEMG
jgi:hypothetical protein